MFKQNGIKTITLKGGERKMKTLCLLLVGALLCLGIPSMASAASPISLTVNATLPSGRNLGDHILLKCRGWKVTNPATFNPWVEDNCPSPSRVKNGTTLAFGELSRFLKDINGNDKLNSPAGCFYAAEFYIVYLYPDAWGGAGYQLSQSAATVPIAIQNSLVFTPVYRSEDGYDINGDGDITDPGEGQQGALNTNGFTGEVPGTAKLAREGGLILTARRPRIVRAEYGIPPIKEDGTPWVTGWVRVPLTTTAGTYTASITITLNPI